MLSKNFNELSKELKDYFADEYDLVVEKIEYLEKIVSEENNHELEYCGSSLRIILEIFLSCFAKKINPDLFSDSSIDINKRKSSIYRINKINDYYEINQNVINSLHNIRKFSNTLVHYNTEKNEEIYNFKDLHSLSSTLRDIWVVLHWLGTEILGVNYNNSSFNFNIYSNTKNKKVKLQENILEINSPTQIEKKNFLNVLLDKKISYFVPPYQRNYDWSRSNIEELLFDLEGIINNEKTIFSYFFGVLSFGRNSEKENSFSIMDGQQRITTILLLLRAIYDVCLKNKITSSKLLNELFNTENSLLINFLKNRINNERTQNLLKYYLLGDEKVLLNDSIYTNRQYKESSVYQNYNYMKNYIFSKINENADASDYIINLLCALSKLEVGIIWFEKDINEFEIFENLNSKSKQLTNYDKIKNFLLSSIDENLYRENDLKIINLFENHIQVKFENYYTKSTIERAQDDFFVFYLNVSNNIYEWRNDLTIYKRFKHYFVKNYVDVNNKITSFENFENFISNLGKYLEVFILASNIHNFEKIDVLKPFYNDAKIIMSNSIILPIISNLILINGTFDQFDSKLLKINNDNDFSEMLKIMEIHYIRRSISGDRLASLGKYVYKVIKAINTNEIKIPKDLWNFLVNDIDLQFQMIPENTFINFIAKRPIDSSNMCKTILSTIENNFSNNNSLLNAFQLLPPNYTEEIINQLNNETDEISYDEIKSEYPEYIDMIGNYFVAKNSKRSLLYKDNIREYCNTINNEAKSLTLDGINGVLTKLDVIDFNIDNILKRSTEISQIVKKYWGDKY